MPAQGAIVESCADKTRGHMSIIFNDVLKMQNKPKQNKTNKQKTPYKEIKQGADA